MRSCLSLLGPLALAAGVVHAQAALVIVEPTINGDSVTLPVHIQGDVVEAVAALDFDLTYDPAVLQPVGVTTGAAATEAGKNVQARVVEDGRFVILMLGPSDGAVAQGEIVQVSMNKIGDPESGESPVAITDTTFATIVGNPIPSQGSSATLLFEEDGESGDAGGLPPTGGGGSIPPDEPAEPSNEPQPDAAGDAKVANPDSPSGDNIVDLANARAAAAERLAMLQEVQAERLSARTALENELPSAGGSTSSATAALPARDRQPRGGVSTNRDAPSTDADDGPKARPEQWPQRLREPVMNPAPPESRTVPAPAKLAPDAADATAGQVQSADSAPEPEASEPSPLGRRLLLAGCIVFVLAAYGLVRRRAA